MIHLFMLNVLGKYKTIFKVTRLFTQNLWSLFIDNRFKAHNLQIFVK